MTLAVAAVPSAERAADSPTLAAWAFSPDPLSAEVPPGTVREKESGGSRSPSPLARLQTRRTAASARRSSSVKGASCSADQTGRAQEVLGVEPALAHADVDIAELHRSRPGSGAWRQLPHAPGGERRVARARPDRRDGSVVAPSPGSSVTSTRAGALHPKPRWRERTHSA